MTVRWWLADQNRVLLTGDPTAHGEVEAIRKAVYWSRIGAVYCSSDLEATREIGFDDAFQYADFQKPDGDRTIVLAHVNPELGAQAYEAWANKPDKHPY